MGVQTQLNKRMYTVANISLEALVTVEGRDITSAKIGEDTESSV